ncbi:MAG: DUF296 domain-containing protein [Chitinophagales bacterium]
MEIFAMHLQPDQDIKEWIDQWAIKNGIEAAFIIACDASFKCTCIRFAERAEAPMLKGKFEILSLVYTLSKHGSHLHIKVGDENGNVTGGHLKTGSLVNTTAEIIIGLSPNHEFRREWDAVTGFNELKLDT